ncbi:MAG: type 4a pilus biogenesis protein PilO [Gemmatimonas sp.]|jgi:type IV pilus assembly protein PilO|uniref:type 4a pilus biogenesis protein PilO n=1 Tax=Gemmatimonas sp. TaxID=1962908 RepID=UPI0022C673A2|nr:type 4a pilus biogenesis protein PilO [Gemmatimonas sp.]MCA2985753.1 type 4a pilus biogenesis protein PilO [Gemmatimonas sp.]MCE2954542.1 type 4a pilus biogenesis protein PilO [Gemmatimonas sp.]MCZ8012332.1 type 4a pilus biogenesis protein PilO [Gemmatimonas sp.]MCZ8266738.1 type 4a pilus biogenesis protein PilO [Gemmatimonas sp.]
MALLPTAQRDQIKLLIGFSAITLAVVYWMYPYAAKNEQLAADEARIATLEVANQKAAREFDSGSIEQLRSQAAQNRSALTVMRRLVPTGNEVPALLEEVSTAARRAGLDVGGVVPEPVVAGDRFDTYRYTVTIIGGYHQFGEFLANVGSLARIVAPVNFAITAGTTNRQRSGVRTSEKGSLAATITLQTYVERTAPAPRAKERSS